MRQRRRRRLLVLGSFAGLVAVVIAIAATYRARVLDQRAEEFYSTYGR
jgi:hypothetical protein